MDATIVGGYRVVGQLGEGGMGAVYVAEHQLLGRRAALKMLLPHVSRDRALVDRFFNEARAATQVKHPGIVEVYDFGYHHDGSAYIVMELLEGESLAALLHRSGGLDWRTARTLSRMIAGAVGAAHAKGIVHRDLKPDNVFLVPDADVAGGLRAKVLDFGIAKLSSEASKTATNAVMGTPTYIAPEQCRSAAHVDARADIYALGCMIFEACTGRPPFLGNDVTQLIASHLFEAPPPLGALAPGVPPALEALVAEMLAKQPEQRPPSMQAVIARLDAIDGAAPAHDTSNRFAAHSAQMPATVAAMPSGMGTPPPAVAAAPTGAPTGTKRRSKAPLIAVGAVLVAGGATAAILIATGTSDKTEGNAGGGSGSVATRADAAVVVTPPAKADAAVPVAPPAPTPPDGMVLIPEAVITMGSRPDEIATAYDWCFELAGKECRKEVYEREGPPRPVAMSPFFLDRRERSVAEVAAWIRGLDGVELVGHTLQRGGVAMLQVHSNPAPSPFRWERGEIVVTPGTESLPATMITHDGARAFCRSLGRDLPTEAQWERAAKGAEGREFPWGELRPACADVVFGRGDKGACGPGGVVAVDTATRDLTPEGVAHLGGNVAEWVHDRMAPYEPCPGGDCRDPIVAPTEDSNEPRVIRGGFAASLAEQTRSNGRSRQPGKNTIANVGFRCAATP